MAGSVHFIDYQEDVSIKVGRVLLSKNFGIALSNGIATSRLTARDSIGILTKNPVTKPKGYLLDLIAARFRRGFLGVIWFRNDDRGATDANWVFEIYGREYIGQMKHLADELAGTFNVKISLRLVCETPVTETFASDYGH